ncbi:hypothetical protein NEISICOT_00686 [Neisseria sicca ATCC 29256]|uniref:Uncharacterized protein n=1 Tax=Neisseria sicca ATCC 29256 TaxID=547045 RepID=C6M2E7_NEISI|nr:hypothetical protein NEISICOT_00686 [Neisseria sicca ATCC 29256]
MEMTVFNIPFPNFYKPSVISFSYACSPHHSVLPVSHFSTPSSA